MDEVFGTLNGIVKSCNSLCTWLNAIVDISRDTCLLLHCNDDTCDFCGYQK